MATANRRPMERPPAEEDARSCRVMGADWQMGIHLKAPRKRGSKMSYTVIINVSGRIIRYTAIGNRDRLLDAAYDRFGACGVTLRPA